MAGFLLAAFTSATQLGCGSSGRPTTAVASPDGPRRDADRARRDNDAAFALLSAGKYAQAESLLRRAIVADDSYGPARNNLGLAHFKLGRLYEAAWEFEAAIRLMPAVPEARNNLGLVLERAGKLDAAVEAYQKARDLDPDRPEYLGNLLRARVRRGDGGDAIRAMLEQFLLADLRPQWQHWARSQLHRLQSPGRGDAPGAETHSSANPSPPGGQDDR